MFIHINSALYIYTNAIRLLIFAAALCALFSITAESEEDYIVIECYGNSIEQDIFGDKETSKESRSFKLFYNRIEGVPCHLITDTNMSCVLHLNLPAEIRRNGIVNKISLITSLDRYTGQIESKKIEYWDRGKLANKFPSINIPDDPTQINTFRGNCKVGKKKF